MQSRIIGIDAFRTIAFFFVVLLHCLPADISGEAGAYGVINHLCRFAVPYFFIVSGYFLAQRGDEIWSTLWRLISRLLPAFLAWVLLYDLYWYLTGQWNEPVYFGLIGHTLLTGHKAFHLWFLPSLGISVGLLVVMRKLPTVFIIAFGFMLYLFALAFGPYKELLHLPDFPYFNGFAFKSRYGPFMGFLFVAIGFAIAKHNIRLSYFQAILLALTGFFIAYAEGSGLSTLGYDDFPLDTFIGTLLMGSGVFFLALHFDGGKIGQSLSELGVIVLGAYCVHVFFREVFSSVLDRSIPVEMIMLVIVVTLCSLSLSTFAVTKAPMLKRFFA